MADLPAPPPRPRRDHPIARLLPVILGGLVVLALVPVIVLAYLASLENYARHFRDRAELQVDAVADRLAAYLDPVAAQLDYLARAAREGGFDPDAPEQRRLALMGALAATPQVAAIGYLPADGRALYRYDRAGLRLEERQAGMAPGALAALDSLRRANGPQWAEPTLSRIFGEPVLTARILLRDGAGRERGVVVAAITTRAFGAYLRAVAERDPAVTPFVLFGRDRVLAHPRLPERRAGEGDGPLPGLDGIGDPVLAQIWDRERRSLTAFAGLTRSQAHWTWVGEASHAYLYRAIGRYGATEWIVGLHTPGTATRTERWTVNLIAIGGVLLLILAVALGIFLGRRMSRPVGALAASARHIGAMEFDRVTAPPRSAFREVNEAGAAFARLAPTLRLFETYLPRALVKRLMAAPRAAGAVETRDVTVLFTDLEGYTAFARDRSAAETADYLNGVLAAIGPVVERHGGTIDKFIGDAVMAFWGAPELDPNHARRACEAAAEMAQALARFNAVRRGAGQPCCRLRAGLHSGPAMVGNFGFAGRIAYTAIGDTVNVAQRLEQAAKDCMAAGEDATILIGGETVRRLDDGWAPGGHRFEEVAIAPRGVVLALVAPIYRLAKA